MQLYLRLVHLRVIETGRLREGEKNQTSHKGIKKCNNENKEKRYFISSAIVNS